MNREQLRCTCTLLWGESRHILWRSTCCSRMNNYCSGGEMWARAVSLYPSVAYWHFHVEGQLPHYITICGWGSVCVYVSFTVFVVYFWFEYTITVHNLKFTFCTKWTAVVQCTLTLLCSNHPLSKGPFKGHRGTGASPGCHWARLPVFYRGDTDKHSHSYSHLQAVFGVTI